MLLTAALATECENIKGKTKKPRAVKRFEHPFDVSLERNILIGNLEHSKNFIITFIPVIVITQSRISQLIGVGIRKAQKTGSAKQFLTL